MSPPGVRTLPSPRPKLLALLAALGLAAALVLGKYAAIRITGATVRIGEGRPTSISFPFSTEHAEGQTLEFAFTIHKGLLTQPSIVFVPDDHFVSLSVNGRRVPLDHVEAKRLDDWREGFTFPIGSYLSAGDNAVVVRVANHAGPGGLDVRSDPRDGRSRAAGLVEIAALLTLLGLGLRRVAVRWEVTVPVLVGVAVRLAYLSVTPYSLRDHDVAGHIEYIEYVLAHRALPPPYQGWSFYHPPLYYVVAALWWKVVTMLGVETRGTILYTLQIQSELFHLAFLGFGLATVSLWMDSLPDSAFGGRLWSRRALMALAATLLCVWPSAVIHSVRLGNDDPFYFWYGGGLYFAARWWRDGANRDLHLAAAFGALGMVTKTNSVMLFVALGALVVWRFLFDEDRRLSTYARRVWPGLAMFAVSAGATLGRALIDIRHGTRTNVLMGNVHALQDNLKVGDRAENFLWLDLQTFVTHAFMSATDDATGRQYFWNYALKSSLLGEFSFDSPALWNLAVMMSVLLLVVVACILWAMLVSSRADAPAVVAVVSLFGSLAAVRASVPMSACADFRYILPALVPMVYLVVRAVLALREAGRRRTAAACAAACWSLAGISIVFFVLLAMNA